MKFRFKQALSISVIWFLPVIVILIESLVILSRGGWDGPNIIYYISFWVIRVILTPFIIFYTDKFWVEHNRRWKLIITHVIGFLIFSLIFTTVAYLSLYSLITTNNFAFLKKGASHAEVYGILGENSFVINVIVYSSCVTIYYLLEYYRRALEATNKAFTLEKFLLQARLDTLKNQLNAHFLFNSLHTINSLVTRRQSDKASEIIIKLSDLLRSSLEEDKQLVPLAKELDLLFSYVDIQKVRFGKKLNVSIMCDSNLHKYLIPVFLLQPLVENAITHAIEPLTTNGEILVEIKKTQNFLSIQIKDNGKTPYSEIDFSNGIGLNNTRERLKALFGEQSTINFFPNEDKNGITVNLLVPLKT